MSPSLIIATLLVSGWNVALTVAAYVTETGPFRSEGRARRRMNSFREPVRAEVAQPELDARSEAWKRTSGVATMEFVSSRITDTQQKVTVPGAYADANVTVATEEGARRRRCTVCRN